MILCQKTGRTSQITGSLTRSCAIAYNDHAYAKFVKMEYSSESVEKAITVALKGLDYKKLKPDQRLAIDHFLHGKDVFVFQQAVANLSATACSQSS